MQISKKTYIAMADKINTQRAEIETLQSDLSSYREDEKSMTQEIETLHNEKVAAQASEKQATYRATRLTRRIMHARAVIHSLLEILDTADHPEG